MIKFKVGNKVRVLKSEDDYLEEIKEMIGGIFEIHSTVYDTSILVYNADKSDIWLFQEDELELIEEQPKNLMSLIARELGVEIGEEFYIENWTSYKHRFTEYQLEVFLTEWTDVDNETYRYVITNVIQIQKLKKPKLTEDERVILENLPKEYKYIARDNGGALYIYDNKPKKDGDIWFIKLDIGDSFNKLNLFEHLFQFIKWEDEEPYNIKELLEEYENLRSE